MPELHPFIACYPTEKLLADSAGFPEALRGISLSRAYADGLLVRDRGEALFRVETTYTDAFGQRFTRSEMLGLVPELKNERRCIVIEKVPGATGIGEGSIAPPTLRGIYLDSSETLRQVLAQRRGEPPVFEADTGGVRHRIMPIRAPEIEMVRNVLADMTWYVPVPGKAPAGRALLSLANWYSTGTRFECARFHAGEAGRARQALGVLRKQLKDDYAIREYPCGSAEGARAAAMEAVEDLRFESAMLPAFAIRVADADSVYLFLGRRPLPKPKSGFFSLAKPSPTRERVRKEVVDPVLEQHGLKPVDAEGQPSLTLYLPGTRPDEYKQFGSTDHAQTLDLVPKPPAPGDYVFPESGYRGK